MSWMWHVRRRVGKFLVSHLRWVGCRGYIGNSFSAFLARFGVCGTERKRMCEGLVQCHIFMYQINWKRGHREAGTELGTMKLGSRMVLRFLCVEHNKKIDGALKLLSLPDTLYGDEDGILVSAWKVS